MSRLGSTDLISAELVNRAFISSRDFRAFSLERGNYVSRDWLFCQTEVSRRSDKNFPCVLRIEFCLFFGVIQAECRKFRFFFRIDTISCCFLIYEIPNFVCVHVTETAANMPPQPQTQRRIITFKYNKMVTSYATF